VFPEPLGPGKSTLSQPPYERLSIGDLPQRRQPGRGLWSARGPHHRDGRPHRAL